MTRGVSPQIMDIMRRFQPSGDFDGNASLSCDPSGFAMVSDQAREEVDYARPPFNWPSRSSPQSNFFVIDGMAVDTLSRSGFVREARSLRARLHLSPPPFDELPTLLHRYLDMEPANADPAKLAALQAMADEMGLDAGALGKVHKKSIKNALAHKCKTVQEEWQWLVDNSATTSAFGKTAACELSLPTMLRLAEMWLPQLGSPCALPDTDASFGNLAWFRRAFPLGWSHIDHLGESAVVSAPPSGDFTSRLALAYFEMADKISRGWDEKDARLFAFNHKNNMDMNGAALFAMGAADFFRDQVMPILSGKAGLGPKGGPTNPLAKFIQGRNPSLAGQHDDMSLWILYCGVDPESSGMIQTIYLDPEKAAKLGLPNAAPKGRQDSSHGAMLARLERLELESTQASLWEMGPPVALPEAAAAVKSSMRL